ncbi:glutamate-5-semialdehyde dehydrogenase [Brucepastera parasyntrophica]|uniref:glutamate-5-semialdehyde dehydrogenase n=1 Tax=Brucepastera parasyntrophica TaxID=2880008 RepID=UPI002109A8C1|nr:glutamate-5-semialdehyde dehydrogenase [Brucepastera parasyntrophica]ULQ59199.1 glutamate-5-semialdehyde dehydrogenase [Brucepastera parasyntrophica]
MDLDAVCKTLRMAAAELAQCTAEQKNIALLGVAGAIDKARSEIITANKKDVELARSGGMTEAMIVRLAVTEKTLDEIIESLHTLAAQTDPIGQVVAGWTVPNGMQIRQVRVPLGVAAVIYESRPNVTVDAFALAYKSSNAVLLRGSSSALESNRVIVAAIRKGLAEAGGVENAIALSEPGTGENSHADVDWILNAAGKIDVALPRGGAALIKRVVETARIPVIETGAGVCHTYIDSSANDEMAVSITENAKIQKPAACNAVECVLVHRDRMESVLPLLREAFIKYEAKTGRKGGVELRCDNRAYAFFKEEAGKSGAGLAENIIQAADSDWGYEFLDYILAVKIVDSAEEAIEYINAHNTKHSETIVTNDRTAARLFQAGIDAACVYVNASTRFTDGGQFGMGAEIGISTQKLHARGPMGLTALTTIKYYIEGEGQVRP